MATMMKCGHAASATDSDGNPVCAICVGIDPGAIIPDNTPDLAGRTAHCTFYGKKTSRRSEGPCGKVCDCEEPSNTDLAFFKHHPDREYDEFYCGCIGWD